MGLLLIFAVSVNFTQSHGFLARYKTSLLNQLLIGRGWLGLIFAC